MNTPIDGKVRRVIFSPETLIALMQHYTEDHQDRIPLDCRLIGMGPTRLERMIAILIESADWESSDTYNRDNKIGAIAPLHFRYEGQKVLSWGGKTQNLAWQPEQSRFDK